MGAVQMADAAAAAAFEQKAVPVAAAGAAARRCCDPAPGRRGRDPGTSAGRCRSGYAARSASPTGCRTGTEKRVRQATGEIYYINFYPQAAQQFIFDNLPDVAEFLVKEKEEKLADA